ncbi:MAG: DUF255 domain-containing protein [Bacteroidetes bacterium]|nr:DUF255 domain-containing protein [Bacteroidota bacterium]
MKTFLITMFLFVFTISASAQESKNPQKASWQTFNTGMQKAKTSGKKILIDVYADWCSWCKKMDAVTYADKKVQDYLNKNFVIIKLNAEASEKIQYSGQTISPMEFSQGMGINGYPATLFMTSSGQPITILPGYSEPDMFIHVLSFIAENQYEKKKFDQYLTEKGVKF